MQLFDIQWFIIFKSIGSDKYMKIGVFLQVNYSKLCGLQVCFLFIVRFLSCLSVPSKV